MGYDPDYARKWRADNKEKSSAYLKKWQAANKDKCREYGRQWRLRNPKAVRDSRRKSRYGIDPNDIRLKRKTCCICRRVRTLWCDHDHKTGKFRGMLCVQCNAGLGMFEDRPDLMLRAIKYLELDL